MCFYMLQNKLNKSCFNHDHYQWVLKKVYFYIIFNNRLLKTFDLQIPMSLYANSRANTTTTPPTQAPTDWERFASCCPPSKPLSGMPSPTALAQPTFRARSLTSARRRQHSNVQRRTTQAIVVRTHPILPIHQEM